MWSNLRSQSTWTWTSVPGAKGVCVKWSASAPRRVTLSTEMPLIVPRSSGWGKKCRSAAEGGRARPHSWTQRPRQKGTRGFGYLSPALGEKQRVFQHHLETAQHVLAAFAPFGRQLRGTAGDHGGGELNGEGRTNKLNLARLSLHTAPPSRSAPSARQHRGPRPAAAPHLPGVAVPLTAERHRRRRPRDAGPARWSAWGGRRPARDNPQCGRVSAQKRESPERDVVGTNLLKTRFADVLGWLATALTV